MTPKTSESIQEINCLNGYKLNMQNIQNHTTDLEMTYKRNISIQNKGGLKLRKGQKNKIYFYFFFKKKTHKI